MILNVLRCFTKGEKYQMNDTLIVCLFFLQLGYKRLVNLMLPPTLDQTRETLCCSLLSDQIVSCNSEAPTFPELTFKRSREKRIPVMDLSKITLNAYHAKNPMIEITKPVK